MPVKNRAFVYIRPSANRRSIQAFVGDWLAAKHFKITARGNFSGGMEEEFDIQHMNSGRKATIISISGVLWIELGGVFGGGVDKEFIGGFRYSGY
jgi:hypothetical protein